MKRHVDQGDPRLGASLVRGLGARLAARIDLVRRAHRTTLSDRDVAVAERSRYGKWTPRAPSGGYRSDLARISIFSPVASVVVISLSTGFFTSASPWREDQSVGHERISSSHSISSPRCIERPRSWRSRARARVSRHPNAHGAW